MSLLFDSLQRAAGTRKSTHSSAPRDPRVEWLIESMRYGVRRSRSSSLFVPSGVTLAALTVFCICVAAATMKSIGIAAPDAPSPPAAPAGKETPAAVGQGVRSEQTASAGGAPKAPAAQPPGDFRRALEHHRNGDLASAAREYEALIARRKLPAQAHNNLGLIYQAQGSLDDAAREFERALAIDPGYGRAHNNLGVIFLVSRRLDAATERFRTAAALTPGDPDPLVNLALVQKAGGHREQAKETLLRALTLSPRSAPAHYNLAVLYDEAGEFARAIEHYRAFLDDHGADHAAQAADVTERLRALDRRN